MILFKVAQPVLKQINKRSVELQNVKVEYETAYGRVLQDLDYLDSLLTQPGQQLAVDEAWRKTVAVMAKHHSEITYPR